MVRRGYFPRILLFLAVLTVFLVPTITSPVRQVHADSLPDLTVDSIWLEEASNPGLPITQVAPDDPFLIVASIKNLGSAAATGFYLDVYYDSSYGRGGPDNIAPGETQTWYVGPVTGQAGTHTTKWVVNPDKQIAESNYDNNEKDFTFTVGQETQSTATSQITQVVTSTGTMNVTSYTTKTVTSYTGTQASTSTIVVFTTVTVSPSSTTSTLQVTQRLTVRSTTQVTSYTTTTITNYTATTTSTSTVIVYKTVANSAAEADGASSSLAFLGFLSLLSLAVGRVTPLRGVASPGSRWWTKRRCSRN